MNRRDFIKHSAIASAGVLALSDQLRAAGQSLTSYLSDHADLSLREKSQSEALWREVGKHFNPADDFINLEYGYFSPATLGTINQEIVGTRMVNARAAQYMRQELFEDIERVRGELATLAGVSPEEVCLTRNTTESMNIVINGLDLAPGDEIVYANQDYGSMMEALRMKAARFGIVLREVRIPVHPVSDEEIVQLYERAITPKTKLLHMTHMYNLSGQIIPVRKICDIGHKHGIESAVDAAHTFAHVDYEIPDLNCAYFGASLHKWLCSPVGLGILYVRNDKIEDLWPLFGDMQSDKSDIRKLEHMGTRPPQQILALSEAIRFHNILGADLKEARLRYLSSTWMNRFREHERVVINTPAEPSRHGALGNVGIRGVNAEDLADYFHHEHNIFTTQKSIPGLFTGVRVTPGIPTPLEHVERFVEAVRDAAEKLG